MGFSRDKMKIWCEPKTGDFFFVRAELEQDEDGWMQ